MGLVIVLAMVVVLNVAALLYGHHSRTRGDWTLRTGR